MQIRLAFRNLAKRPLLNLIKIAGLSLGLTGIILILLLIKNELSFDRYNKNSERIFRLTTTDQRLFEGKHFARLYYPYNVPVLAEKFPGIESYLRLVPVRGGVVRYNERYYRINEGFECDSTFFQVFDAELLSGNPYNVLNKPAAMVVSESFAQRVFGKTNPVGRTITLPSGQYYGKNVDFTVSGIMKDFPQNSHFHPEFIATPENQDEFKGWAWTYLLLRPVSKSGQIAADLSKFMSQNENADSAMQIEAHLQNLTHIHLHSDKLREIEPNGNLFMIFTLAAAAFILLFISLINYINLNLGMAVFSDRYLHISRIYGSSNFTRLTYHMAEGLIVVLISIALSILVITTTHRLLMQHFALNLMKGNTLFILFIMMVFGMLSVFPSIMVMLRYGLYRIQTGFRQQHNHHLYRKGVSKGLIVFQYAISTALVISVIVMMRQTSFSLKASLGNDSGQLVCMEDVHSDVQKKFPVFKEELLKYKSIIAVTAMLDPPGGEANDMFEFEMEGFRKGTEKNQIGILSCDYSFAKVFDLKFLAGTDFSPTNTDHDGSGEYIINRSALKRLGYGQPEAIIGKPFRLLFDDTVVKFPSGTIIGVVDDFHLSGIRKKVEPMVLFKRNDMWLINFVVKSEPGMQVKALSDMERVWKELFPEHPFEYRTVSSIYRHVYKSELLQLRLLSLFTFLALFMCSMGLLGLSLLTAQRRTKEIGIRVVNGARTGEILFMLNWYYLKWILLSFIIAFPLAWFGMNKWLENFVYKTSLDTWIFVVASLTTIVIAMMTVSFQSWSAARRNPVEALRYE